MATQTSSNGGGEDPEAASRPRKARKSSRSGSSGSQRLHYSGWTAPASSVASTAPGESVRASYGLAAAPEGRCEELSGECGACAEQSSARTEYRLELAQQPTRGRTCGFGDADRRALSAPLIARLRLYNASDGSELDPDSVDVAFLVCAADLWSSDTSEEMNLVHHPAYHHARLTNLSVSPMSTHAQLSAGRDLKPPIPPVPQPLYLSGPPIGSEGYPMASFSVHAAGASQPYPYPRRMTSTGPNLEESAYPPRIPSASSSYQLPLPRSNDTSPTSNTFAFQAPFQGTAEAVELVRRQSSQASTSTIPPRTGSSSTRPWTSFTNNRPSTAATSVSMMTAGSVPPPPTAAGRADVRPLESDCACVKNLVGALTTNAHRLKAPGEAEWGIFFVFHDLSVRTEGTFTLRLRLASIGSLTEGLRIGSMPILCETYTQPFEVMSAKKFPGMLDPTALSQAFAKQGLRIPTRKGANRKRHRTDTLSVPGETEEGESTPMPDEGDEDQENRSP